MHGLFVVNLSPLNDILISSRLTWKYYQIWSSISQFTNWRSNCWNSSFLEHVEETGYSCRHCIYLPNHPVSKYLGNTNKFRAASDASQLQLASHWTRNHWTKMIDILVATIRLEHNCFHSRCHLIAQSWRKSNNVNISSNQMARINAATKWTILIEKSRLSWQYRIWHHFNYGYGRHFEITVGNQIYNSAIHKQY